MAYQTRDARKSLAVPLRLAKLCCQAARLCPVLIKKSNVNLISDVAVAAIFLESAFAAAYFNVEINLRSLANAKLTGAIRKELKPMQKIVSKIRKNAEAGVGKIIRG